MSYKNNFNSKRVIHIIVNAGRSVILALLFIFITAYAATLYAQDISLTDEPVLLFSDAGDIVESNTPQEVRNMLNKIRQRRETASAKLVILTNPTRMIDAQMIQFELGGKTYVYQHKSYGSLNEEENPKQFWIGESTNGDKLDLLYREGRLAARFYTGDQAYKIIPLQGPLNALVQINHLGDAASNCDVGEERATTRQLSSITAKKLEPDVYKTATTQYYTKILVLYTQDALDNYSSLQNLNDAVFYGLWDASIALNGTDATTNLSLEGTELTSFDEPSSWPVSDTLWAHAEAKDAEFANLRAQYEADVIMLMVDNSTSQTTPRGNARDISPTNLQDAMFYVQSSFVDNPGFFTPAHEIGHIFGALHGDGYFIRDSQNQSVVDVCYYSNPTQTKRDRTLMHTLSGENDRRVQYYSASGKTVTLPCPDDPVSHVFKRGDFTHNAEPEIENNEDAISNLYETYGGSSKVASNGIIKDAIDIEAPVNPLTFKVENYPNPFNPETVIHFTLPEEGYVRLVIYDVLGREVDVLVNETQEPGRHEARFEGRGLPSGLYLYRMTALGEASHHKTTGHLLLLK